jgi:hypothetical protein
MHEIRSHMAVEKMLLCNIARLATQLAKKGPKSWETKKGAHARFKPAPLHYKPKPYHSDQVLRKMFEYYMQTKLHNLTHLNSF